MSDVLVNPVQHKVNVYFAPGDIVTVCTSETYIIDSETRTVKDVAFKRPIDHGAATTKLVVKINDTVLTSKVETVENAKQTYAKALRQGKRASLVKHDDKDGDEYNVYLGNLSKGDRVLIEMEYVALLDDKGVFAISNCVTPRYSRGTTEGAARATRGGLLSWIGSLFGSRRGSTSCMGGAGTSGLASSPAGVAPGVTEIFVDYSNDPAISSVRVLTPGVVLRGLDPEVHPSCLSCTVAENGCAGFAVQVSTNATPRVTVCARVHPTDGTTALLASVLPSREMLEPGTAAPPPPKAVPVYFVLDCSGSMTGRRINQVRDAVQFFLLSLPEGTPVEFYKFGSTFEPLFGSAQPLTEAIMPQITAFRTSLNANMGGTEVWGVLEAVFKQPGPKNVLFVTDGEVHEIASVAALCRAHSHDNRVFSLGIEVVQSRELIRAVAEATGGTHEIVLDVNDLSAKATALVRSTQEAFGWSCSVDWGVPPHVKTFDGSCALNYCSRADFMSIVSSEVFHTSTAPITISFVVNGQPVTLAVPRADVRVLNSNVNLHAAAALKVIQAQLRTSVGFADKGVGAALRNLRAALGLSVNTFTDVKALALKYNIMVKDVTAFVAVDESGHVVHRGEAPEEDRDGYMGPLVRRGGRNERIGRVGGGSFETLCLKGARMPQPRGGAGGDSEDDAPRRARRDDDDDDGDGSDGSLGVMDVTLESGVFRAGARPVQPTGNTGTGPHAAALRAVESTTDSCPFPFSMGARPAAPALGGDLGSGPGRAIAAELLACVRLNGAIELSTHLVDVLFHKGAVGVMMGQVSSLNVALTVLALAFLEKHYHGCGEWTGIQAKARAFVGASIDTYLAAARAFLL